MAAKKKRDPFLESLMDTNLYSMGAYFSDRHPELVDDVIEQSVAIEDRGLAGYAEDNEPHRRGVLPDAPHRPGGALLQGRGVLTESLR